VFDAAAAANDHRTASSVGALTPEVYARRFPPVAAQQRRLQALEAVLGAELEAARRTLRLPTLAYSQLQAANGAVDECLLELSLTSPAQRLVPADWVEVGRTARLRRVRPPAVHALVDRGGGGGGGEVIVTRALLREAADAAWTAWCREASAALHAPLGAAVRALATLDTLAAFAHAAHQHRWVRPAVWDATQGPAAVLAVAARHPMAEAAGAAFASTRVAEAAARVARGDVDAGVAGWDSVAVGGAFVPNPVALWGWRGLEGSSLADEDDAGALLRTLASGADDARAPAALAAWVRALVARGGQADVAALAACPPCRLALLTGANLGGKSTWARTSALLAVLAQAGSFVPATAAAIGTLDGLHTRMGAGDDLAAGQSTFALEAAAAAAALRAAGPRSFALFDELGRGTSTLDGTAIAAATLRALHAARSLGVFVTHYGPLARLAEQRPGEPAAAPSPLWRPLRGVGAFHMAVLLSDDAADGRGRVTFLYRLTAGVAGEAHGLRVAALAGLPRAVLARAWTLAAALRTNTGGV
jgi:DNA mismatch repair ATPase MutS